MSEINKINVTTGVSWIEVPSAGVKILCGCPADSVKHLAKRGLIINKEIDGNVFEDGPNVILLSDIMIQNGDFSNLAEFPVLQMLYKQGMMLPNHPNNTGVKPILVGSHEQITAQLDYIYRGNYGLISESEMVASGISSTWAKELMRMKLRFAFGKIKKSKDFLDTRVLADKAIEIKNGVFIERKELNKFVIRYKEEEVSVDLNLYPGEQYHAPYPLGYYNIKREYFAIIHSGEGDGWDINRPCMSSIIMFHGKIYLIDAGGNISNTLNALGIGINEIEGIFHTHCHDDHFCGLATLIQSDRKIKYYSTPLVRHSVVKKLSALLSFDEDNFYDYFDTYDLDFNTWTNIEGLEVKPMLSPHPVENNIFCFRTLWMEGYMEYAHFADIASFSILEGMVTEDNNAIGISKELYEQTKSIYLSPVDLKKIDVGGGLIHGEAIDFKEDQSKKIILSHTSQELDHEQKKIGSGAPFGIVDILIPDYQDFLRKNVYYYLHDYFANMEGHSLRILMNNPIETFNPESILIKEGEVNKNIYLILTGNIDMLQSNTAFYHKLSAGTLLGEISGLNKAPSPKTYRAKSFVQALSIPSKLYIEFVLQNKLYGRIEHLKDKREFLKKSILFGEDISYPVLNKVAETLETIHVLQNEYIEPDCESIYIVKTGKIERSQHGKCIEVLSEGSFFGEEDSIFELPSLYEFKTLSACEVFVIPVEFIASVPIIKWKLFENFKKRIRKHLDTSLI